MGRVTAVPRLPWGAWLAIDVLEMDVDDLVALARSGDEAAFAAIVEPHRRELLAHAYRMLGSVVEAEDALQETLLAAWRGLPGFAGRSSLRTWLFKIATHACLRLASKHPPRLLSSDYGPARTGVEDLGDPVPGPVWLEPFPEDATPSTLNGDLDPAVAYLQRESVELAFVAALQHLPGTQAAVLLRDVLGYSAAETAEALGTSVPSANSALQRARATLAERRPQRSQQAELTALDDAATAPLSTPSSPPGSAPTFPLWSSCSPPTHASPCRRCRPGSTAATTWPSSSPVGCWPLPGDSCPSRRTRSWPLPATSTTASDTGWARSTCSRCATASSAGSRLCRPRHGRVVRAAPGGSPRRPMSSAPRVSQYG